jgi:hypothetical protein
MIFFKLFYREIYPELHDENVDRGKIPIVGSEDSVPETRLAYYESSVFATEPDSPYQTGCVIQVISIPLPGGSNFC